MLERRQERRVGAGNVRARIRLGHPLVIVNVSARGALVEARCQLRPGARLDVQLETDARNGTVGARVTRCTVVAIEPEAGVTYRAALWFSETCDWVREVATQAG